MADAIRAITVEQGHDPRDAALVAFGGAGPLFGTLLADELDVDAIVVPPLAGNFSAWGLLGADLAQTASRTRIIRLERRRGARATRSPPSCSPSSRAAPARGAQREVHLDMRYVGQEHTLTIAAPSADGRVATTLPAMSALFEREYAPHVRPLDGRGARDRVDRAVGARAAPRAAVPADRRSSDPSRSRERRGVVVRAGRGASFALVGASPRPGDTLAGPAIVTETTATTYLDAGFGAEVHRAARSSPGGSAHERGTRSPRPIRSRPR